MDQPWEHAKWKKPETKTTLYDSTHTMYRIGKFIETESWLVNNCPGLGGGHGEGRVTKRYGVLFCDETSGIRCNSGRTLGIY